MTPQIYEIMPNKYNFNKFSKKFSKFQRTFILCTGDVKRNHSPPAEQTRIYSQEKPRVNIQCQDTLHKSLRQQKTNPIKSKVSRRKATTQHGKESNVQKGLTSFKAKYLVRESIYCIRFILISDNKGEEKIIPLSEFVLTFWIVSCINYEILDWIVWKRKSIDLIPQHHYQPKNHFSNHSVK